MSPEKRNRTLVRALFGVAVLLAVFTVVYVAFFK